MRHMFGSTVLQSVPKNSGVEDLPAPSEVHLWFSRPENASKKLLEAIGRDLLTDEEIAKSRHFYFPRDQKRFLLTRILQRTLLSRYHAVAPRNWIFAENAFGRPCIAIPKEKSERFVQFNISHTNELVVLAVGQALEIGIDVERIRAVIMPAQIANHYFSTEESAGLRHAPEHLRDRRFLELWTLKEAYTKAKGRGLSIALDSFAFCLGAGTVRLAPASGQAYEAESWQFVQFEAFGDHVGALCLGPCAGAPLRLHAREIVPFEWERPLELKITGRSC